MTRAILIVAIASIPILLSAGALMIRQEWRRRDRIEAAHQAAKARVSRGQGEAMATVTGQVPGSPTSDARSPRPARWDEGAEIVERIDPADPATWGPDRRHGPQMVLHVPPRPPSVLDDCEAVRAELAAVAAERDRLRLENARLRSELELCPPPSEVARVIRDEGPIAAADIAYRVGATTWQVEREAQALTVPRAGNPGQVSTLWPQLDGGIDASDVLAADPNDQPLWAWTAHLDDLGLADVATNPDLGVTDWGALEAMVAELAGPVGIGAGR